MAYNWNLNNIIDIEALSNHEYVSIVLTNFSGGRGGDGTGARDGDGGGDGTGDEIGGRDRRYSETWDWDKDYNTYRNSVRDGVVWFGGYVGPWVQSAWDGCLNVWDYLVWKLYGANLVKKLPYNRCHICMSEIDPLYLYNLNDVRHKYCNVCYEKEAEKMIEELELLDLGF